jgi:flagellar basal body rod protein FlgG
MLRGIYSVASAMETAARNHEIIAENLVNATTPGYRRQGLLYESASASTSPAPSALNTGRSRSNGPGSNSYLYTDPGPLQQTNNPYDVALAGNAFFVLQGPNGPLYTRNGSFQLGPGGQLQARGSGYPVSGSGGQGITIPPDATNVTIGSDGTVFSSGAEIGRLQLASFARPDTLQRVGPTLFQGENPQTPPADSIRVEQGYREGSNVQPVQEMVSMMLGMRFYEAAGKALQAITDAVAQNTKPSQS